MNATPVRNFPPRSVSTPPHQHTGEAFFGGACEIFRRFTLGSTIRSAVLTLVVLPLSALHAQTFYATPHAFMTLAGSVGSPGSTDGTGSAARFGSPYGMAVDSTGNVFVADNSNHTIRKITPAGVVTTLAGLAGNSGSADGTGSAARFNFPFGLAVDVSGTVYVADYFNHTIRKITPAGVVTTLAGSAGSGGSSDGTGSAARFYVPTDVAVDGSGNVYVADYGNHMLRKITSAGVVTTLAGAATISGSADGTGNAARFNRPNGVAVDGSGNVYVADYLNHTIRKITAAGVVTTVAGSAGNNGTTDGAGSAARFNHPSSVAADALGNLFAVDYIGQTIRKVTAAGVVTSIGGSTGILGSTDGTGSAALFNYPVRVAVDGSGNVYVADNVNNTIRKGTPPAASPLITRVLGASITLTAIATGTPTPTFQWKKAGVNISGATSSTYVIPSVQTQHAGSYTVAVANTAGSTISNIGTLTIVSTVPGDFNGDGNPDLLWQNAATGERSFWFMIGTAVAGGETLGVIPMEWEVATVGDFNRDGHTDLFWQNTISGERVIWLMNGTGITSNVSVAVVTPDWQIVGTGDFNGDGQLDLVWQHVVTGNLVVWTLQGTVPNGGANIGSLPVDWSVAFAGDYNMDGNPDLVLQNRATGERAIWLMNGFTFSSSVSLGITPLDWSLAGGTDLNMDGKNDILLQNTLTGERRVRLMNGTAVSGEVSIATIGTDWSLFIPPLVRRSHADFNNDGKTDLVLQNNVTGERQIRLMDGTTLNSSVSLGTGQLDLKLAGTGDFNGDGQSDLVLENLSTGERLLWLMQGTSFSSSVSLGNTAVAWSIACTGDFNRDGRSDLVLQNTVTGERQIWLMNGTSVGSVVSLGVVSLGWQIVATGDFDGDRNTDIVWQNTSSGERLLWFMGGTLTRSSVLLGVVPLEWKIVGTGDFNRDSKTDIIWQNTASGERTTWLMVGTLVSGSLSMGNLPLDWSIRN